MTSRRPHRVYGVGQEPDPRFTLANERTFLAWIRTTLALLAAAVAIHALADDVPVLLRQVSAVGLAVCAVGASVQSWRGWAAAERAMRVGEPLPAARFTVVVAAGCALCALVLGVGIALGS